jgi:hypothetical protein
MNIRFFAFAALATVSTAVFAQDGPFQVRYASNLAVGDSVVNLTNDGAASTTDGLMSAGLGFQQDGQLCANIYAYSPDEQLVSCCSCNVTPNGLNSLSAKNDLASNTLTPIIPSALVIKIVTTPGGSACTATSAATIPTSASTLSGTAYRGLMVWGTTIHALPVTPGTPATTYGVTETAFSQGTPSDAELSRMKNLCAFIRANGSGYGICKSCKIGGLGASAR